MLDDDKLARDLVWGADGHLTEIALAALADGQEALLDADAPAHAGACAACAAALGHAALLSLRAGEALRSQAAAEDARRAEAPASASLAPPLPWRAVVGALLVAAVGAAPALVADAGALPDAWSRARHAAPLVWRAGRALAQGGAATGWFVALPWISAALLIMAGLAIARATGKRLSMEGGV